MELKQRKRIANKLPEFDEGLNGWQWGSSQPTYVWNNYSGEDVLKQGLNPGLSYEMPQQSPADVPNAMAIGNPYRYNDITTAVTQTEPEKTLEPYKNSTQHSTSGMKVGNAISGAASIAGGVINQVNSVKGVGEMMTEAGTTNRNIGGIGYQSQNYIDEGAEKRRVNAGGLSNTIGGVATGASAGASFGPIGAVVGGVVGGVAGLVGWGVSKSKLRKRLDNARQLTARVNTGAQSGAMSTALQQDYYTQNGNTGGVLYANKGKDIL